SVVVFGQAVGDVLHLLNVAQQVTDALFLDGDGHCGHLLSYRLLPVFSGAARGSAPGSFTYVDTVGICGHRGSASPVAARMPWPRARSPPHAGTRAVCRIV